MAMQLFKHNQQAYEAVVAMLAESGKAAVIHPTGTGKSFIGFKLCEDNPGRRILWLSPSKYIFRTQLENWAAVHGNLDISTIFVCEDGYKLGRWKRCQLTALKRGTMKAEKVEMLRKIGFMEYLR